MATIKELEKDVWQEPSHDSYLVQRIYELRKKDLEAFTVEDFRMLIGQELSLPILIPLALTILEQDLMAEGDYYPGDLLKAVVSISPEFWKPHRDYWEVTRSQISERLNELDEAGIEYGSFLRLFAVY